MGCGLYQGLWNVNYCFYTEYNNIYNLFIRDYSNSSDKIKFTGEATCYHKKSNTYIAYMKIYAYNNGDYMIDFYNLENNTSIRHKHTDGITISRPL